MIPGSANPLLLGQTGTGGFSIERSLRFNSGDSAYLNRTPSSASNRKTFTFSCWVKRSKFALGSEYYPRLLATARTSGTCEFNFMNNDALRLQLSEGSAITTQVFRDCSAWYHIVLAVDTTKASNSDRIKMYVNGSQVTDFASYPTITQNSDTAVNAAQSHAIGYYVHGGGQYLDGYLADVHFIDGQALAATDFGETDDDGVWQPKKVNITSPNDGTVWSNNISGGTLSGYPATNAFDGNTSNFTYAAASSTMTCTFNPPITGTQIEIYALSGGNWPEILVDGAGIGTHNQVWVDVSSQAGGSLSTITCPGVSNAQSGFAAVRIDGVILVDNVGAYGTNGFHLDFKDNSSNAALGTDTSGNSNTWTVNNLSVATGSLLAKISGGNSNSGSPTGKEDLLNGSITGGYIYPSAGNDVVFNNFSISSARIYAFNGNYNSNYANGKVYTNSSTTPILTLPHDNAYQWYALPTDATLLYKFEGSSGPGNQIFAIRAIESGGAILTDGPAADNDSLRDSPTNGTQTDTGAGGEVVGNYATMNPLAMASGLSLSNGNLDAAGAAVYGCVTSTIFASSGKYYFEYTLNAYHNDAAVGVVTTDANPNADYLGAQASSVGYLADGRVFYNASLTHTFSSYAAGDVIGVAFDVDTGKIWFAKNNTWLNSGDPAAGSNPVTTISSGKPLGAGYRGVGSGAGSFNFGQRAFAHPVSGYKSLNTANLPEPTIADGSKYFDTVLWSGDGSGAITVPGLSLNNAPGFVWSKTRNHGYHNNLWDAVRGFGTSATALITDYLGSANGGTLNSVTSSSLSFSGGVWHNQSGKTYVAWNWDAGSSTVSNTDGSITSQVRANPSAGFSIVSYVGTGANATFGHGLNAPLGMVIIKNRNTTNDWIVGHQSLSYTSNEYILLNSTAAKNTGAIVFNSQAPTSSIVNVGAAAATNGNSNNMIAYCFAPVAGYSAMGSYSSGSDPFVFTGFLPRFVLLKKTNAVGHWYMFDSKRGPINPNETWLEANGSGAEQTHANGDIRFLSNGFQPIGSDIDASSGSYIYYAVAENPFQANGGLAR